MKDFINITLLIFALTSCKAQTPIVAIDAPRTSTSDGAYFKDLNNELNRFEGTWLFTNGADSLTLKFQKRQMTYNGTDYEDKLIGEYKYMGNGIEVVNTLTNIDNNNPAKHKMSGNLFIPNDLFLGCDDCSPNERRVMLTFYDSERSYLSASIILRYIHGAEFGEPAKMKVTIIGGEGMIPNENSPTETRVPYGEYLMIKE